MSAKRRQVVIAVCAYDDPQNLRKRGVVHAHQHVRNTKPSEELKGVLGFFHLKCFFLCLWCMRVSFPQGIPTTRSGLSSLCRFHPFPTPCSSKQPRKTSQQRVSAVLLTRSLPRHYMFGPHLHPTPPPCSVRLCTDLLRRETASFT